VITETAADNVRRGAELLDRVQPGWADRIDLDRLDLGSDCECVLGQLYGGPDDDEDPSYLVGRRTLGLTTTEAAAEYGFTVDYSGDPWSWAELDRLWMAEIRARRDTGRDGGTNGGDR
jgi:hypothetical protein